jgi:hypothetical protein
MTVPEPADPSVMPCCERTPAMVMAAMSRPAAEVFGWTQIFEIKFIEVLLFETSWAARAAGLVGELSRQE